jgi:tetratricopeptide (TPR) repeat protein
MKLRGGNLLVVLAAFAAFGGALSLQMLRDRWYPRDVQEQERILYVRSGEALKRIVLGFDALAADVYWIRAIQHYGGDRVSAPGAGAKYQLLYPLLDLTTTLDPYFNIAYRFGAIFLSEGYPGGPGRPDQSVALLRKALVHMPQKWQYYHDIGFVYYWTLSDFQTAALWFQRASERPNAPNWLKPLAAAMLTKGDDRAAARFLWEQIQKSEEEWMRRNATRALMQIDALNQIDQLEAGIARFPLGPGEPYTWDAYIKKGVLRGGVPLDPTGTPYELDPETGGVTVSKESQLSPMPDATRRVQ